MAFGGFSLNSFESKFGKAKDAFDALAQPATSVRGRAQGVANQRLLDAAEANRIRSVDSLRKRSLEERQQIANAGDFDLHIQGFVPGALPGSAARSPVPRFNKPVGLVRKDTKATIVIEDPGQVARRYTQEFILSGLSRDASERYQLEATFGGFDLLLYGSDPVVYTCRGYIYDGAHVNTSWYDRFLDLYHNRISGTVAARDGRSVYLYYSGRVVEGVIVKLRIAGEADPGNLMDFSWVMIVLQDNAISTRNSGDEERDTSQGVDLSEPTTGQFLGGEGFAR